MVYFFLIFFGPLFVSLFLHACKDINSDESTNKPSRAKVVSIPVEIETTKNYSDHFKFPKKSPKLNVQPMRTLTLNGIRNEPYVPYDPSLVFACFHNQLKKF